jgi:hypothetical protein|tara:strand:+ start:544 stop:828 length:285 start_codon:yes stop_codon:yes gene_type:complete
MKNKIESYKTEVFLHTKVGCHICGVAEQMLKALGRTLPIKLTKVLVTEKDELFERVPAVYISGELRTEGKIDLEIVRAAVVHDRIKNGRINPNV